MRTGATWGLVLAFLVVSGLAFAGDPFAAAGAVGSVEGAALRAAAQYGPLAVAIVLFGLQLGRTIQGTVRDTVASLRDRGITVRVDLQCPHLDHLQRIQRHLDLEDARAAVAERERATR